MRGALLDEIASLAMSLELDVAVLPAVVALSLGGIPDAGKRETTGDRYHGWPPAVTTSGAASARVDVMGSTVASSPDAIADKANELATSFDLTVLVHRKGA